MVVNTVVSSYKSIYLNFNRKKKKFFNIILVIKKMDNRIYYVKNLKTKEVVKIGNPLRVVHHLQRQQKGFLDISINLVDAFNKDYRVIKIVNK